ncbi:MAG TPA: urease accessory protein UreD [Xanthomonadales bacterium]|nr:urease accessory protein UreD [Xanthomonadales bacterium]
MTLCLPMIDTDAAKAAPTCAGALGPPPWHASLQLRFATDDPACTRLVHNRHRGPLRVQRVLYPEGPDLAHVLVLHPPGGIAGGDQLDLDIRLEVGAKVLLTTPGASKWYHGERAGARQSMVLKLAADTCLEWLPQEAILFDGADASQEMHIDLDPSATLFSWDIVQLGRIAAAEQWQRGRWRQRLLMRRDDRERWREVADLAANDPLRDSSLGLAGYPVMATAWAAAPTLAAHQAELVEALRERAARFSLPCGISWLPAPTELLLIRALGPTGELVRALLETLWNVLRPAVIGRSAHRPRIWDT